MTNDNASMRVRKPELTAGEQIVHLKSRGVTFELCSEEEAAGYLSNANNYLRAVSIDVEHFAKMELMRRCDERGEDGYSIVSDYLISLSARRRDYLETSLNARGGSGGARDEYSGGLISHYAGEYPI